MWLRIRRQVRTSARVRLSDVVGEGAAVLAAAPSIPWALPQSDARSSRHGMKRRVRNSAAGRWRVDMHRTHELIFLMNWSDRTNYGRMAGAARRTWLRQRGRPLIRLK